MPLIKCFSFLTVASVLVAVQAMSKEERAMFVRHSAECLPESNVDAALIKRLMAGDFMIDDANLKKHILCVMVKCKIMSKHGKFKKTAAVSKIPLGTDFAQAFKAIEYCSNIGGTSPEETAWNLFKCGFEKKNMIFGENFFKSVTAS